MAGLGIEAAALNVLVAPKLASDFAERLTKGVGDAVGPAADKVGKTFGDKLSANFESAGKKASLAITAPLTALATKGVFDAQKIQSGLAEVVSLSGKTGEAAREQIQLLTEDVAKLSGELGIAQETLVGGLYQAISAGVPQEDVFTFLEVAGKAAIAGVTDTETAVDGLTTVINAFGLTSDDAEAVSDSLFTAVKGGKTTFEELSASLFNVAPAAAAAGVDFQTVNAAIATLTAAGVPTSVATTQIRAALVGLQRPSEDLDTIFADLGYTTRAAAIEQLGLQGALAAVRDAADGDQGALQQLLGSVEAVGATNVLAGTGAEKFTAELEAQANAAGATQDAFDVIDQTRNFERLKVQLQNLSVQVGNVLLPVVTDVVEFITKLADGFNGLPDSTKKLIVVLGGIAAAVGPVLIFAAKVINAVKVITGVVKLLNFTLLLNPWVLVGIAAVAAVVLIVKYWDEIVAFFKDLWEGIKEGAEAVFDFLGGVFDSVADAVSGVGEVVGDALTAVVDFFNGVGRAIGDGITAAFNVVSDIVGTVVGAFQAVFDAIITVARPFWDLFANLAGLAFDIIRLGIDIFLLPLRVAFEIVKAIAAPVWELVKAGAELAFEGIRKAIDIWLIPYRIAFAAAQTIAGVVWGVIKTVGSAAFGAIRAVAGVVFGVLRVGFNGIRTVATAVWGGVRTVATTAFNVVRSGVQALVGFITRVVQPLGRVFSAIWDTLKNAAQKAYDIVMAIIDGIRGAIQGAGDAIKNLPKTIAGGVTSLPGKALGAIGSLVGLADGGVAQGGVPYVVGEEGPELFVPRTTGTVVPNDVAGRLAGGDTYNITINNPRTEPASTTIPEALRSAAYLKG